MTLTLVSEKLPQVDSRARRVPELDGLRGVAISLVVLWHYFFGPNFVWTEPWRFVPLWARPFGLTWSGVELFFVLSGFLLTNVLLDAKGSRNYYPTFYIRRALRILPVYLLVLVPFAFVHCFRSFGQTDTISLWSYFTFTQNIAGALKGDFGLWWMSATWSLAVEEHFYLVLPVLVHKLSVRGLTVFSISAIMLAPALRIWALNTPAVAEASRWQIAYLATPCRIDALAFGVLVAIIYRKGLAGARSVPWMVAFLSVLNFWQLAMGWDPRSIRSGVFGYSLLGAFYAAVLLLAISRPESTLARALKSRPLIWIGGLSYAIYLFHEIFLWSGHLVLNHDSPTSSTPRALIISLGALALTIWAALLSKAHVEGPAIRLGRSFKY